MKISLRLLLVLVLLSGVLGGCHHVWRGPVPPMCQPSSEPLTLPPDILESGRLRPGNLFIQVIADQNEGTSAYAFLIYTTTMHGLTGDWDLNAGHAKLTHIIGPIVTLEEWRAFNNSLRSFASTRPGGFFCDNPDAGGCPDNKASQVLEWDGERLAWGPLPPGPPPPESFGAIQSTQLASSSTLSGWTSAAPTEKKALYASMSNLPANPASCRPIEPTEERRKELGAYVYRALATRAASYGEPPYPYTPPPDKPDAGSPDAGR